MIQFQGSKDYAVSAEKLFPELADLSRLVKTLPDVKTIKEVDESHALIIVAPSFSFVKGELETKIERTAAQPPVSATLLVSSKGIGTSVKVAASFVIASTETGCTLNWQAQVQEMGGLLKLVPTSLLQGAARKVIDGWLDGLQQTLSA